MKKKLTVFLSIIMASMLAFSLIACKDNDDPGGGSNLSFEQAVEKVQDMPTSTDESVIENAIGEVFGADINLPEGTYNAQVYNANGVSAYTVTVSGANTTASDYYNSIKSEMASKGYTPIDTELSFIKVVGEVSYVVGVEDSDNEISVYMGVSQIQTDEGGPGGTGGPVGPAGPNTYSEWPANEINSALGDNFPPYTGSAESFTIEPYNQAGLVGLTITIKGANSDDLYLYMSQGQIFRDYGYSGAGSNIWHKRLANGNNLVIPTYFEGGYDDNSRPTTLSFTVYIEKNSGVFSSWPTTQIAANFSLSGIPTYEGGTSFDFENLLASGYDDLIQAAEMIIQGYEIANQYGAVDAELEAEYEKALELIEEAEKVRAGRITVYGTTEEERQAYVTKVLASPNNSGEGNFILTGSNEYSRMYTYYGTEYRISMTISEVEEGKVFLDLLRVPASLLDDDDIPQNQFGYTLPENVKIVYNDGIYQYTIYKIGEDYYKGKQYLPGSGFESDIIEEIYYRKNGNVWDIYEKDIYDEDWVLDTDWNENDKRDLERDIFGFMVESYYNNGEATGTETIAGIECTIYEIDDNYYKNICWQHEQSKLILKEEIYYNNGTTLGVSTEVTEFNVNVTSFEDVELPQ